jgi:hypothetical protein
VLVAGSGGTSGVPFGWTCDPAAYHDGVCDCGCSVPDPDCGASDYAHCARCNAEGSCSGADCPGLINRDNPVRCVAPPNGWTCSSRSYQDGVCDCGCGYPDPDCKDDTLASCERCTDEGGCSRTACPSSVDPQDTTHCAVPKGWVCESWTYADGTCDCGCGVVDVDCKSASADDCENCPLYGCAPYGCQNGAIMQDDNAFCSQAPPNWTCSPRLYNDGSGCDCGCNFPDPDCSSLAGAVCDRCNDNNSCSSQACPGLIDPSDNAHCAPLAPPPEWTCGDYFYANGVCDCGCGAVDPDCADTSINSCIECPTCGSYHCPALIDPTATTKCQGAPSAWTCDDSRYGDGTCDCGCGVIDIDCPTTGTFDCYSCPPEGCSGGQCDHILGNDLAHCAFDIPSTWQCDRGYYGDGICDCGCGVIDHDCAKADRSVCVICNDSGSCSSAKCLGSINPSDNSSCSSGTGASGVP